MYSYDPTEDLHEAEQELLGEPDEPKVSCLGPQGCLCVGSTSGPDAPWSQSSLSVVTFAFGSRALRQEGLGRGMWGGTLQSIQAAPSSMPHPKSSAVEDDLPRRALCIQLSCTSNAGDGV